MPEALVTEGKLGVGDIKCDHDQRLTREISVIYFIFH